MSDSEFSPDKSSKRSLPFSVRLEPRFENPPGWYSASLSVGAVVIALIIGGVIIAAVGGDPIRSYIHIARASVGSVGVLSDTIVKATPLILVGLACSVAFRMGLWNIGAEGQFFLGAFGASAVVLIPLLPPDASPLLYIPAMIIAGVMAGALWAFVPGFLKARFGVNEIISTLMMNYIAVAWNNYFIFAVWSEGGFQMSPMFTRNAWLPRLTDYAEQFPFLSGLTAHLGLIIALLATLLVWFVIYRSRWGYEIRLIGDNPEAAKYAGINISRNIILVMMFSGGLAGLAGVSEISGVVHRLQGSISPGYGFTGIIIAWLAKLNPFGVVLVSFLFGALILAGREIQPSGIPRMIQGVILVCLIASDFLFRYRVRISRQSVEA
jgi:simple sugar transport system permease protein